MITDINIFPNGAEGIGELGKIGQDVEASGSRFAQILSTMIGVISIIGIIWFIFIVILGAIGIISAGDDKQSMANARKRIVNGLIGMAVIIVGLFLVRLFGLIFGIGDILDIANLIENIAPTVNLN